MKKFYFVILIFLFFSFHVSSEEIFLSLKKNKVNVRYGPSLNSPVKFIYKKINLPVKQIDKKENWRRIIDLKNNSGWIHVSQLSKKKTAITIIDNLIIYKKYTIYFKPIAKLAEGRLVLIKKCRINWCKIKSSNFKVWFL